MRILLTGFEPFGGETINPSWQAVQSVAGRGCFADVHTVLLPTEYYRSVSVAVAAIDDLSPDIVLSVGQAGGRTAVSFERVAVNIVDSDVPDNAGNVFHTVNCFGGKDQLFSTLPLDEMVEKVRRNGLPAYVSENAGRFVCNHVFYGILKHIAERGLNVKAGFCHVPYIPEQTTDKPFKPSMSLDNITDSIVAALAVLI